MRIIIAEHATREEYLFVTDAGDTELASIVQRWETETGRNLATEGAKFVARDVRFYAVANLGGDKPTLAVFLDRIKASAPAWLATIEGFVGDTADYVQGLVTRPAAPVNQFPQFDEIAGMTPGERRLRLIALLRALGSKADRVGLALTDEGVEEILTHIVGDLDAINDKIGPEGWRKFLDIGE